MGNKTDMTLVVNVSVNGSIDANGNPSVTAQYTQGPTVPNSSNVVDDSGNVNLRNMAFDGNQYDKDTDITFNLSGRITDSYGNPLNFNFPGDPSQAVTITQNGNPSNQMTVRSGSSPMQVIIDDQDNDGKTYGYCLGVQVATQPYPRMVQLDPSIVNR